VLVGVVRCPAFPNSFSMTQTTVTLLVGIMIMMNGSFFTTRTKSTATTVVRGATFLSNYYGKQRSATNNNPSWRMTSTATTSRRNGRFPLDDGIIRGELLLLSEAADITKSTASTTTRVNQEKMLPPQLLSSRLTVVGMIPRMRQFQHRSISFWSWIGKEETEEDTIPAAPTTISAATTNKATKASSSSSSSFKSLYDSSNTDPTPSRRRIQVSYCSELGFRPYMEDEFFISDDGDFCCCFDGHGGRAVSRYLKKNLYANVQAFLPAWVLKQHLRTIAGTGTSTTEREGNDMALVDETQAAIDGLMISTANRSTTTRQLPTVQDYATALESALDKIDKEILRISHWSFQGSTAVVIWILRDVFVAENNDNNNSNNGGAEKKAPTQTILAANIGDSRAVLCRNDTAWDLTTDHKPTDPSEKQRIESRGGSVIWCGDVDYYGNPIEDRGVYRVNGHLALSRAIGDRAERPHVSASPDMVAVQVEDGDEFVILATDGLWDVMDSTEAVSYVKFVLESGLSKEKVASQMVQEALRRGTFDNITVLVIWL
jgi:serine/threonine protein phosphatase PrpC